MPGVRRSEAGSFADIGFNFGVGCLGDTISRCFYLFENYINAYFCIGGRRALLGLM